MNKVYNSLVAIEIVTGSQVNMRSRHGEYDISVQGNILLTVLKGAWNKEQCQEYCRKVKKEAAIFVGQNWARVVVLSQWEGGCKEVIEQLNLLHAWSQEHHCRHVAYVNPSLLSRYLLDKHAERRGESMIFSCLNEAMERVTALLAETKVSIIPGARDETSA